MRCKRCGGEITLEAAYCLHCGAPNEHALQHVKDMETYRERFEGTRSDVQEVIHRYTGVTVRVVIAAILVVVSILLCILGGKAYELRRWWKGTRAEQNAAAYMEEMDRLLEAEDFLAFGAFCQERGIDTYDTSFEKYAPVRQAALQYQAVYNEILAVACPPSYGDPARSLEYLADYLDYFYESLDMERYEYLEGADNAVNRRALAALEERVALLLITYCDLPDEVAEAFPDLSRGQRAVALEEAVLHE